MASDMYSDLVPCDANYVPLTPVCFLARSAEAYAHKVAIIDGMRRYTYREFYDRSRRLAAALTSRGIGQGDTVSIIAPNIAPMLEAHYGIPMAGAVLNALNTRLDANTLGFCLKHGCAKLILADSEYVPLIRKAMTSARISVPVVVISQVGEEIEQGDESYEDMLATANPTAPIAGVRNEWSPISLGYTSGTTGDPKGVVCHHRGAYLNTLGNVLAARMDDQTVYLWTLPMFHCNGWSHTWAVTAAGGSHVCLRKIDAETIISLIRDLGITHLSAAPVVLDMLASSSSAGTSALPRPVRILTGGSVPPTPTIASIERLGFKVMHIYGLTESTGPSLVCEWQDEWNTLPREAQIANRVRQGVRLVTMYEAKVANPETGHEVAADGAEMGELLLRGNTLMMGYLRNREATDRSFADGWFHTGDLAVRHPDGYVEIKDRAKDIIISGGENISSVEVEEVLFRHPSIREVAVVAKPDDKWGEHPCAFVDLKEGAKPVDADALSEYCRKNLAGFKIPKTFIFGPLPRTSTGKVQKHTLRAIARDFHPQENRA